MSSISLDFLKSPNVARKTAGADYAADHHIAVTDDYTYKDLYIDIEPNQVFATKGLNAQPTFKELKTLTDIECIVTSIRNILETVPGQKLLNPYLGINLMHLVFQPITVYTGQQIAQVIALGLQEQEPRLKIENVHCTGFPDVNEYAVAIKASIPGIKNTRLGISISNVENESIY